MKYTVEAAEKSTVKIKITLTAKEWADAQTDAYNKTKGRYSVPGFRKGKVPKHIVEQYYGAGVFFDEAINQSFPKYYFDILDKEPTIEAIDRPELDIEKVSEKGITYIAIVPVKPEVKLAEYKGIKFDKIEYNVTDKDVEDELDRLVKRNAREIEVTDRPCQKGDITIIDYSGSIDGVKFDGGTAEKQTLELGAGRFIPGFEEQVEGMKIGEEKDITVKFPEEYHAEDLKGKDAVFAIKLHEIKAKELPEVNDDFIKEAAGEESLEAYKAATKKKLQEANDRRAKAELEDKIVKTIAEKSEFASSLSKVVSGLSVVVEKYPDLKANDMFGKLQSAITNSEEQLQASRRIYNSNVSQINTAIVTFPTSFVARKINIQKKAFFEAEEAKKADVKMEF